MGKIAFFLLFFSVLYGKEVISVFGASPPATYLLYSFNPKIIAGINYSFRDNELKYLKSEVVSLPIIGGWFGQGRTPNFETLIKVNPDLVVTWNYNKSFGKVNMKLKSLGFKTFGVNVDSLKDYINVYSQMGKMLSMEERAQELSFYTKVHLKELESMRKNIKRTKSVYYAEGQDGLQTECNNSVHADLIEFVGAYNPHQCNNKIGYGRERISLEQLMIYDPEIIITQEKSFYKSVYKNDKLKDIKAIKNKAVYFIPNSPFSWFDRPPSFMKILGAQWLGNVVYKDIYKIDMEKRVKEFYKLFLGVTLSENEINLLLEGK